MVRYRDLIRVPVADNGEPIVQLSSELGPKVIVRKSVLAKLVKARAILRKASPTLSLYLTCGYRAMEVQTNRFVGKLLEIAKGKLFENPVDLYEEVHRFIAVPTVAGHPTGGAVDITIKDITSDRYLDFGAKQYDYSTKNCYVFAPMDNVARRNRLLLRKVMMRAGFAPFDGEWWHFSYGDREWAYYYKKPRAIYNQLSLLQVKKLLEGSTTKMRHLTRLL